MPEDPVHSRNTLEWVFRLKPGADEALRIAALGHDIERAITERKVKRGDYKDYDEFKQAHALNSAEILREIMADCSADKELADNVYSLVVCHETGGDRRADALRDADSISFFHVNLPHYFVRNTLEETKRRCLWGFRRLPDALKGVVAGFQYDDEELQSLVQACFALSSPG